MSDIKDEEDYIERSIACSFVSTLQAGYTDFHYLRDIWKKTTEEDALIGVSMTGIASDSNLTLPFKKAAKAVKEMNGDLAKEININPAARQTAVKPAGTTSLVVGSSSGIHAWHNDYYIRRIRLGKNEAIYKYLKDTVPNLIEDEYFSPDSQAVISVPQKAPYGAITRSESTLDLLERVKLISKEWVRNGHVKGSNTHNVSCTVSIKDGEWEKVGKWMWDNKDYYNGLSVLPFDGGTYKQTPFEDCTKEQFESLSSELKHLDLSKVIEIQDDTSFSDSVACGGGSCEIK